MKFRVEKFEFKVRGSKLMNWEYKFSDPTKPEICSAQQSYMYSAVNSQITVHYLLY